MTTANTFYPCTRISSHGPVTAQLILGGLRISQQLGNHTVMKIKDDLDYIRDLTIPQALWAGSL